MFLQLHVNSMDALDRCYHQQVAICYGRGTRLSVEILQLTKHPIYKLESRAYRVALFADGRTDTRRRHVPRLA